MMLLKGAFKRLYQNQNSADQSLSGSYITLVSGLPRSGTSMMMQMLVAGGLPLLVDDQRQPDENNPRGYLELEAVKQLPSGEVGWLANARGKVVKVVSPLLRYLPADQEYRVILMRRNLEDVIRSQQQMMDNLDAQVDTQPNDLLDKYQRHLDIAERNLSALAHTRLLVLNYDDVLQQPKHAAQTLAGFLNQPLAIRPMVKAVQPDMNHQRL